MEENAIILVAGNFKHSIGKTTHGLVRKSKKYKIVGVIDYNLSGKDAGELLDGQIRHIPIYSSVREFELKSSVKAKMAIVGIALPGGSIPDNLKTEIIDSIKSGMSIVSGLHVYLSEDEELTALAERLNVSIIDIRKPKLKKDLKFWSGKIYNVKSPIISVLGTDCALGKRTTASLVVDGMNSESFNVQMIYTGQTGCLQGYKYGFIFDSTYNDFVCGELENAIVTCYQETKPDLIILEGQSSLCNPNGPCGAEFLLSARAKGVILQHAPARKYYKGQEEMEVAISLEREMALISTYGAEILAITLNTKGLNIEETVAWKEKLSKEYNIPVVLPLEEGVKTLIDIIKLYINGWDFQNSVN